MDIGTAIPVFRSFDEARARAFYVDYLGFTWEGQYRFGKTTPLYAFLSKGALHLHLSEHHGDATPGSTIMVNVSDVQSVLDDLRRRRHPNANPSLQDLPWGKQISVKDPFGNTLRFLEKQAGAQRPPQETS